MTKQTFLTLALSMLGVAAMAQPRSASEPTLLIKSSQGLMAPVWSPSGDKIAVTSDNYDGIWVADADGSNLRQVTCCSGAGYKMQWSADGTKLLGIIPQRCSCKLARLAHQRGLCAVGGIPHLYFVKHAVV